MTSPGQSDVVFVLKNGVLAGRVVAAVGTFELRPTGNGFYVINQLQASDTSHQDVPQAPPVPGFVLAPLSRRSQIDRTESATDSAASVVDWPSAVNSRRAEAGLPAVTENAVYSAGDLLHARYVVKNNMLVHAEDPSNPWYTPAGDAAGRASNVAGHSDVNAPDQYAVDAWMQAPFHAVGILDPKLREVGFGSYREALGGIQMGAALDVIRGRSSSTTVQYPVAWPAAGTTIAAPNPEVCPAGTACFWGEVPDPLTSCGYVAPAGLPIILQLGAGNVTPRVTSSSLTAGGGVLEHCVFDQTSYTNPDLALQTDGRSILQARNAIVMIPRAPLPIGQTYIVTIVANGSARTWSFAIRSSSVLLVPASPNSLTATSLGTSVTLRWNAPAGSATPATYIIEAGLTPGTANLANFSTGNTATTFSTTGVGAGTYYVRVRAANAAGTSAPSNEAVVVVGGGSCTSAPGPPSGLGFSVAGSTVTLLWNASTGPTTSYIVEAGSSTGFTDLANFDTGGTPPSLTATGVGIGTYFVRVKGRNACGTSGPSNEVVVLVR